MKMYILVKSDVPLGTAMVAHASLAACLKYKHSDAVRTRLRGPFYKTVCRVNEREFENAKSFDDYVIITESSLNNEPGFGRWRWHLNQGMNGPSRFVTTRCINSPQV